MLRRVGTDYEAKRKYDREAKAARTKQRKASGTYVRSGSHEDMARWTATKKPRRTMVKSFGCNSSCGKLDCSKAYAGEKALMVHQQREADLKLAGPRLALSGRPYWPRSPSPRFPGAVCLVLSALGALVGFRLCGGSLSMPLPPS